MKRIIENIDRCFGCSACCLVCPTKCIKMAENNEGFLIPHFDASKCINCKLCEKSCQMLINIKKKSIEDQNFVVRSKEVGNLKESSSGGAFSTMAILFINDGGIVYGAGVENDRVQHVRVDNIEDISRIQNSKYVQSDINDSYRLCYEDLKNGKKVLFGATPCQIAGLLMYLKKDYENLYCVDIICHGTPSQKLLRNNLLSFNIKHYGDIHFRYKNNPLNSKSSFIMSVAINNKTKRFSRNEFYYFDLFLKGKIFRKSCYECPYANMERVGDITIGDVDSFYLYDFYKNTSNSSFIINTNKGYELFTRTITYFDIFPLNIKEESRVNKQLSAPSKKDIDRDRIYNLSDEEFMKEAFEFYIKNKSLKNIIYKYKNLYISTSLIRKIGEFKIKCANLLKKNIKK